MTSTVADDSAPVRRLWRAVLRRWPSWLAVAMTAASLLGSFTPEGVPPLAQVLLILPLLYLVVAKLRRPQASWLVLAILIVPFLALRALNIVSPTAVYAGVAVIVLVWGALDGRLRRPDAFRIQALGMIGFGVLSMVGLIVDPELARYVVAAGFLAHGIWDFAHLKLDKVISRSYAEWCGVIDILIAARLVFMM